MKKALSLILCISMIISSAVCVMAEESKEYEKIYLTVNNETFLDEPYGIRENDDIIIPLRRVFETMGADVTWIDDEKAVVVESGETSIRLKIGSAQMTKKTAKDEGFETEIIELDSDVKIINDSTFVPLHTVSQAFGYEFILLESQYLYILSGVELDDVDTSELVKYNIISEEDLDKDTYITNLEAFQAINNVVNGGRLKKDLNGIYKDDLSQIPDYLDDETKGLLLALCRTNVRNNIIISTELTDMDMHENMTEYHTLVFITRMIGNTYGCTDNAIEFSVGEEAEVYLNAFAKGLTDSMDMTNADKPIEREYFYTLLDRALHITYTTGGWGGISYQRYIDKISERGSAILPSFPDLTE